MGDAEPMPCRLSKRRFPEFVFYIIYGYNTKLTIFGVNGLYSCLSVSAFTYILPLYMQFSTP